MTDDGPGIDPQVRARILEPFYTTRLADGGSGLGLSVVHGIMADHAGQLEVEDARGGGMGFSVQLPIWIESSSERRDLTADRGPAEGVDSAASQGSKAQHGAPLVTA